MYLFLCRTNYSENLFFGIIMPIQFLGGRAPSRRSPIWRIVLLPRLLLHVLTLIIQTTKTEIEKCRPSSLLNPSLEVPSLLIFLKTLSMRGPFCLCDEYLE